jgi:hypothetical protein
MLDNDSNNDLDFEITSDLKLMVYDLETIPLKSWHFGLGKQVLRHGSLDKTHRNYDVICATYCFNDGKPARALHWGHGHETSAAMLAKFDKIIKRAQDNNVIIIGKNNKRFDDKHLNTQRLLNGEPGMPDWVTHTEDLERQMRRNFYLPSYALDYFSSLLGYGGKIKMEMSDWIHIVEYKRLKQLIQIIGEEAAQKASMHLFGREYLDVLREGRIALNKMVEYGKKDSEDTRDLIIKVAPHCQFKSNIQQWKGILRCKNPLCGSDQLKQNGTRVISGNSWQTFYCNAHGGYAGRAQQNQHTKMWGKMV